MKKWVNVPFLIAAAISLHAETIVYVSPGAAGGSGRSADSPLGTLESAAAEVKKLKASGASGPYVVELQPGVYQRDGSFVLDASDSGDKSAAVVFRGSGKGEARLSGARSVKLSEFQRVTDEKLLTRLDPAARDHVVSLDLAALNITHAGPFPPKFEGRGGIFELFDAQGRLPISRWPNTGFSTMKRVLEVGDKNIPGVFEYREDRPSRWTENPDVWLCGQWRVGWEDPAIKVDHIDPAAGTITFAVGIPNGIGSKYRRPGGSGEEPWYALNLPEEIDQPGEWAIDFASGRLLLWPRPVPTRSSSPSLINRSSGSMERMTWSLRTWSLSILWVTESSLRVSNAAKSQAVWCAILRAAASS